MSSYTDFECGLKLSASTAKQGAALLNAQAVHLDTLEVRHVHDHALIYADVQVLSLVPDEWPLDEVSTFFQRGLRRELHNKATSQIFKSIAAGQNLQTSEAYLERILGIPPVIADGPSPMSMPDEGSIAEKEDGPFALTGEKEAVSTGAMEEKEKSGGNGFFSPEIVNKELREIHGVVSDEGEELR